MINTVIFAGLATIAWFVVPVVAANTVIFAGIKATLASVGF